MKTPLNAGQPELQIYSAIGYGGVTAKGFRAELEKHNGKRVTLRINSPGGEVFDGWAIYQAVRDHKGGVDILIDGLAASMASVICMAGKKITIAEPAMMMLHNPWSLSIGESSDMRKTADLLDEIKVQIVKAYALKTRQTTAEIGRLMDEETWLSSDDAFQHGFVDVIAPLEGQAKARAESLLREAGELFADLAGVDPSQIAAHIREADLAILNRQLNIDGGNKDDMTRGQIYQHWAALEGQAKVAFHARHWSLLESELAHRQSTMAARAGSQQSSHGQQSTTPHLDQWNALQGGQRTAYFRAHKTAILVEADRLDRGATTSTAAGNDDAAIYDRWKAATGAERTLLFDQHKDAIFREDARRNAAAPAPANVHRSVLT